jgi:hypothetical protein
MLRPDDREFGKRFQDLLLDKRHDHVEGWRLCQDLGRPAVAVLWDLYEKQGADVRKRMVLMVAAALAGGPAEDERLLQALDSAKVEERVLAAMLMALGPRRPATAANPWSRLVGKQRAQAPFILQVAAYLAASRFPAAAADRQLPVPPEPEPGLSAAAAAAGVAGIDVGPWFPPASRPPHADLVRRGALLGRMFDPGPDQSLLLKAEALFRSDSESDETRVCAALLLGRAGRLPATSGRDAMARPSGLLVEGLTVAPAAARPLREWLDPVPNQLDKDARRLLSAYVFSRSVAEVLADQERWLASPTARRPVALSLALRLLAGEASAPPVSVPAPTDLPEWFWVAWAAGQHPPRPAVRGEDPVLDQAVDLAIDGRLPRATARVLLEEALWRSEAHPGLPLWRSWRWLVRDLLLTGSIPGIKYAPTTAKLYRAPGLGPEHPLFDVAVEYFDFTEKPRSPLPPECRLP